MKFKKLSVDWLYVKIVIGFVLIAILSYNAGQAIEESENCGGIIKQSNNLVKECNAKIRECNNIPVEFNLSEVINYNGSS